MSEPPEPYVLGDLVVEYADRRVTFAGSPVELMASELRLVTLIPEVGQETFGRNCWQQDLSIYILRQPQVTNRSFLF